MLRSVTIQMYDVIEWCPADMVPIMNNHMYSGVFISWFFFPVPIPLPSTLSNWNKNHQWSPNAISDGWFFYFFSHLTAIWFCTMLSFTMIFRTTLSPGFLSDWLLCKFHLLPPALSVLYMSLLRVPSLAFLFTRHTDSVMTSMALK